MQDQAFLEGKVSTHALNCQLRHGAVQLCENFQLKKSRVSLLRRRNCFGEDDVKASICLTSRAVTQGEFSVEKLQKFRSKPHAEDRLTYVEFAICIDHDDVDACDLVQCSILEFEAGRIDVVVAQAYAVGNWRRAEAGVQQFAGEVQEELQRISKSWGDCACYEQFGERGAGASGGEGDGEARGARVAARCDGHARPGSVLRRHSGFL